MCSHLHCPVVFFGRVAMHVAGVAAARASSHLHTRRPDQEVGGCGIDLTARDLVDHCASLTDGGHCLF